MLEWVAEEELKEYKNLHYNRCAQGRGDHRVHYIGEGPGREPAADSAGSQDVEATKDDDNEDEPAEMAVSAFVANNLHTGGNMGS